MPIPHRRGPATQSGVTRPSLRVAAPSRYLTYSEEFKPKADALAAAKGDAARFVHTLHGDLDEGRVRFGTQGDAWQEWRPQPAPNAARFAKELALEPDSYASLNAQGAGIRALVADLDFYKLERWKDARPAEVFREVMQWAVQDDVPPPNLVTFTGRGLQCIWTTTPGTPRAAREAHETLVLWLSWFGADPKVTDRGRMVRLPGTVNSKSGETACILLCEPIRYDFRQLTRALGTSIREPVVGIGERAGRARKARAKVEAPRQPISARASVRAPERQGRFPLVPRRILELEALIKLRGGTVPEGLRNEAVHIAAVHLLQVKADPMAWAATYAPELSPQAIAATIKTARQKRYRYSSETIGTKLEVTNAEVEALGLTSIKAKGESRAAYLERKRAEKARAKRERYRAANPAKVSQEIEAPWVKEGCSRATWYRRRAGGE